jgi:phosphatidylglycerophosphate synthase
MLEDYIKKEFQKLLGPVFINLKNIGFTPNRITALSILSGIIAAFFFYKGLLITGGIFVLLDYFFDGIDGMVARLTNNLSSRGFILDHLSDYVIRRIWYFSLTLGGFLSYKLLSLSIFSLAISVFFFFFSMIKKLKIPSWTTAWADWLIIPAIFSGEIILFFQIMVVAHLILFILNFSLVMYLNK